MPASRLRIAMLSAHSCPAGTLGTKDTGGMSVYIVELARQLGKQGHIVDAYTRTHDPQDKQIYDLGENFRLIHLRAGQDEEIHKLAVYPYLPDFACNLEDFRKRNDLHYDIIFSHYWLSGWVGKYLEQWWQVPHIVMFHTLGAVKNATGIGEEEPELRVVAERDLARTCQIIAPTEKEKESIVSLYGAPPERIAVVPCGVNLDLFRPIDQPAARKELGLSDDPLVLFVGRIEPLKGVDQLIEAMSYLRDTPAPRLLIIGGDEQSQHEIERLQGLCRELGVEDRVSFRGLVQHEKLPHYYSAADVCAMPSYYESFGLVALESLACGTPVVASDVGNLREVIRQGQTGYVVAENTPRNLADRMAELLSRASLEKRSVHAIRASVSRFGWPNIAAEIVGEFRRVLASYPTPVP